MAEFTVKGLRELQAKMEQMMRDIQGDPILQALAKAMMVVERAAKKNAPVDRGMLRASITPQVMDRGEKLVGVVGSNVKYAAYQELGTRPHWPPWEPLYQWARRKSKGNVRAARALAQAARRAIARRGNVALHYLENALNDSRDQMARIIANAVNGVVNK